MGRPDLGDLTELAQVIRDPKRVARAMAEELEVAVPRASSLVCIFGSRPAFSYSAAASRVEGAWFSTAGLSHAFAQSPVRYDRDRILPSHRSRFVLLHPDRQGRLDLLARFWAGVAGTPFHRSILADQEGLPYAYVSMSGAGGRVLDAQERARVRSTIDRARSILALTCSANLDGRHTLANELSRPIPQVLLNADGCAIYVNPLARALLRGQSTALGQLERLTERYGRSFVCEASGMRFEVRREEHDGAGVFFRAVQRTSPAAPITRLEPNALSERERELVRWLRLGLTNARIAQRMCLSPHTVKTMLERLYFKHGLRSRVELATASALGEPI